MFRRSHHLKSHSFIGALEDAEPAPHTVLVNDKCLHLLGAGDLPHLDGIKVTSLDTCLATLAQLLIYDRPEPAGSYQLVDVSQLLESMNYLTAAFAAIAGGGYLARIRG